MNLNISKLNIT